MYPFGVHTPMLRYIQYHFTLLRAFLQVNERKSLMGPQGTKNPGPFFRKGKTGPVCKNREIFYEDERARSYFSKPAICLMAFMAKVRVRPMATPAIRQG